jgi:hypothetical protein
MVSAGNANWLVRNRRFFPVYAAADEHFATHRAALIAEATTVVERWQREGFFGRA